MKVLEKYKPQEIEGKWQKIWEEKRIYQPDLKKAQRPFYNLMMFPYPSAEGLHVGNMYAFTGADIYGRFKRMQMFDVFEPIGLDGFGIHSENYALKIGRHPAVQAKVSEKNFYRQLREIGNGFAWENKLETYDPDYYRWTQWLFLQMFKNGLAYRKKSPVNFCPSCKTVLADEQVIQGVCERCKSQVEKKEMEQWFFKITAYAERLLKNTYRQDFRWPEKVKVGQRNWIGKKEGINITYPIVDKQGKSLKDKNKVLTVTCFTTRPDTNFGATFVVVAPEHPLVKFLLESRVLAISDSKSREIKNYVEMAKRKSEAERIAEGREKTGVFTGFYALNPLTSYKMPIWISDFVLGEVGTGAVVGVPAHDSRDYEFAKKFALPIKVVVLPEENSKFSLQNEELKFKIQNEWKEGAYEGEGVVINSSFLNGLKTKEAIEKIMDYLEQKGWGKRMIIYKLRDWCISRQRYWGAPIPMIYCPSCAKEGLGWLSLHQAKFQKKLNIKEMDLMPGWYPVPEEDLPVVLPLDIKDWRPEGTGKGPLAKIPSFVKTKCPYCGREAQRETDVCDTFLDSSWYFLRYPSVNLQKKTSKKAKLPWDEEITKKWLPVHQYTGGAEHTVLHLLYSRFITMALKDMGYLHFEEPFSCFYAHGLIIAEGAKMSKSRGNIVNPDEYIRKYGADTLRTYLMFLGPFDQGGDFRDTGIAGMYRFLGRVWRLVNDYWQDRKRKKIDTKGADFEFKRIMHRTIKEVTEDLENMRYNTAIAHLMEYVNKISNLKFERRDLSDEGIKTLLLLLAPFAPFLTEELWNRLRQLSSGKNGDFQSIHRMPWPQYDAQYLMEEEVTIIVQINGKTRETIKVEHQKSKVKSEIEEMAKKSEKIQKYLLGKTIEKIIFVPGKLINFVLR